MGKTGLVASVVVLGFLGFGIWAAVFYDDGPQYIDTDEILSTVKNTATTEQIDTNSMAQDIHNLVNAERTKAGLKPFTWDSTLASIASDHSQNMATFDFVDHRDQNSRHPIQRYQAVDYYCPYGAAENIYYYGAETSDFAEMAVDSWMDSKQHRENILTAQLTKQGIGVAIGDNGMYATQNFC